MFLSTITIGYELPKNVSTDVPNSIRSGACGCTFSSKTGAGRVRGGLVINYPNYPETDGGRVELLTLMSDSVVQYQVR